MSLDINTPERVTTTSQAYNAVLTAILDGSLKSGQSLSLKGLSDSLGMSAMPIREALRQLEGIGVVEIIPHRGARVRPLSLDDLVDTYDARIPLERALIRRTAARMDDATAVRARAALDRQAEALATGNFAAARSAHEDFHLTLYRAAESPWLFRLCKQVWLNSERYQALTMTEYAHVHERRLEHQAILDACQTHQPDKAEKALERHLTRTVTFLSSAMANEHEEVEHRTLTSRAP
ncbi:GntR family transcriptional regulator [Georgenia yuyongxinii]|uniref:GntR family transcriptional regulator n=2 Tax=Georgenia yuyongxinii TaxID=2589797 RepID=A0A5B8C5A8_9MICO|nr:GntR family transcriptional regulator [Georgenia yuyongxinii]QDC25714.1 GntR family transcriptional regulator [Georgenia yuyongxinii]